ncbi:MAG: hypothetical protein A2340_13015 [Lentisphaerae bacterium RIFOXYB12_FULL_60_10]|nr:MAG: hypothetical protein A2340_13015 [Lentisphaerae bacterium RIFOXYB12_FULL_60_10]
MMEKGSTYAYVLLTGMVGIVFWIAIAASVGMDYAVARVTFADAVVKAVRTPVGTVFQDSFAQGYLWFLVSVVGAATTIFMPRASFRIGAVIIFMLVSLSVGSLLAPLLALAFPLYLATGSDGETWGEAWPAMSAVGFWLVISAGYIVVQWVCHKRRIRSSPNNGVHGMLASTPP